MAKNYRVNTRRFLNNLGFHSSAHIIAQVEDTTRRAYGDRADDGHIVNCDIARCTCFNYPELTLIIADCSRSISLDFELGEDYAERKNSFDKINGLIADLEEFRDAMLAEAKHQDAVRRAKRDANTAKESEKVSA